MASGSEPDNTRPAVDFLLERGPGDRLGPYEIVRKIGEGGMGVVFEARDADGTAFAVKVLSDWLSTKLGRARFEREIDACALLEHENTIRICERGEDGGTLFYAMEYLDGLDLGKLVAQDGAQAPGRCVRIVEQIAGALGEAHGRGLIHRDIKPPNIIVSENPNGAGESAKLVDFGLVLPLHERGGQRLTLDGNALGTPRYTSPEALIPGAEMSPMSDFYALGLVAYFLVAGRHAFEAESAAEILKKQRDELPPPLEGVSRSLAAVITRCLEKNPADRPATAEELRAALCKTSEANTWSADDACTWWRSYRDAVSEPCP